MDIFKSLRPLVLSLNPTSANTIHRLRERRAKLSSEVTDLINTLGPELFPDFDSARIIADPFTKGSGLPPISISQQGRRDSEVSSDGFSPIDEHERAASFVGNGLGAWNNNLPRNESFANLGNIGLFASRPASRARSRSNSGGFPIKALSHVDGAGQAGFEEVSRKISSAMAERRRERSRRRSGSRGWLIEGEEEAVEVEGESSDSDEEEEEAVEGAAEGKKHV